MIQIIFFNLEYSFTEIVIIKVTLQIVKYRVERAKWLHTYCG